MQNDNGSHYFFYYNIIFLLNIIGIGVSTYLCLSHFWIYTDVTYSSFCAISQAINCDTVAQSPWSVILGLPVAQWGLLGYLFFLILLLPLRKASQSSRSLWAFLVLLSSLFALVSIFFGYISATRIHSYCILCLISYFVSFSLFYLSWFIRRRVKTGSFFQDLTTFCQYLARNKLLFSLIIFLCIIGISLQAFLPHYWLLEAPPVSTNLPTGVTDTGHPWIGAENPTLTIEEFSDYQCFQCAKTHLILRRLVAQHPNTLRLVHRHYPMDHAFNPMIVPEPFHVGSGKMALLAIYAMTKNKFWEMNDALFELGRAKEPFNTRNLAKKVGIPSTELVAALSHPLIKQQLDRDILRGMKLRILGTPSFVIKDKVYTGYIPSEILNSILKNSK